jgi:hypothetical protein
VLLALYVAIDDPARDFTSNFARISDTAGDPRLRTREYAISAHELAAAIELAARRITNWEYIGTAGVDGRTTIVFERTSRMWKLKDDVILRVEQVDDRVRLTGESRSRLDYGDLGQNPRNLRRILTELDSVLELTAQDRPAAS